MSLYSWGSLWFGRFLVGRAWNHDDDVEAVQQDCVVTNDIQLQRVELVFCCRSHNSTEVQREVKNVDARGWLDIVVKRRL